METIAKHPKNVPEMRVFRLSLPRFAVTAPMSVSVGGCRVQGSPGGSKGLVEKISLGLQGLLQLCYRGMSQTESAAASPPARPIKGLKAKRTVLDTCYSDNSGVSSS